MLGKPSILSLFPISLNKFNKTQALMKGPLFSKFHQKALVVKQKYTAIPVVYHCLQNDSIF